MTKVLLSGEALDLATAWKVSRTSGNDVALSEDAKARVAHSRRLVDRVIEEGRVVYGITTGFGRLKNVTIPSSEVRALQGNLLRSHAVGTGPPASDEVVRLLLLFRLQTLAKGFSGIRGSTLDAVTALLREDLLPVVPMQGSVGASGDLAPLAHLALVLIGEGKARWRGKLLPGSEALSVANLTPVTLEAKEGLALINGTQFSAAVAAHALEKAWNLAATADLACSLSIEAWQGSVKPFDARVAALRPHPGHAEVSANVRRLLAQSQILESHRDCTKVQDPYSFRCAPQVHGASRDALRHLTEVLEREINSATDNPLVFADTDETLSAGNFHAEPLGLPCDYAAIAVAELASISERRLENLVNPDLSGLPAFLAAGKPGLHSGLVMAQVTAAALVSGNKSLAHPASVDSIPTSANQEDHVSMSPIAARHLASILENATRVIAIELLAAYFAVHWRRPLEAGLGVEAVIRELRRVVPPPGEDRAFAQDIETITELIESGILVQAAEAASGPLHRGPAGSLWKPTVGKSS